VIENIFKELKTGGLPYRTAQNPLLYLLFLSEIRVFLGTTILNFINQSLL